MGCPAPYSLLFFVHLSATFFLSHLSRLPKKCALPPLRADLVHLSKISLRTRAPASFHGEDGSDMYTLIK